MTPEFEAKFLNIDEQAFRNTPTKLGAIQFLSKTLFHRQIFGIPSTSTEKRWLRICDEGNKITVTLKQVHDTTVIGGVQAEVLSLSGSHDHRQEQL